MSAYNAHEYAPAVPTYDRPVTYAGARRIVDADSHVMERPDFLVEHADPAVRDRIPPLDGGRTGLDLHVGRPHRRRPRRAGRARRRPHQARPQVARRPRRRRPGRAQHRPRPARLRAPGRLLVGVLAAVLGAPTPTLRYASYRAHNRAMAAWCAVDRRLHRRGPVRPRRRGAGARRARRRPRPRPRPRAAAGPGAGRPVARVTRDHEPFWARLAERRRAVRAPRRQRPAADRRRVDERRPHAGRADGGRRDHRLEGLHGRVPLGRAVPVGARARRRAGAAPDAARRRHRDGRRLGADDAAPPRPRRRHLEPLRAAPGRVPAHADRAGRRPAPLHAVPVRGRGPAVPRVRPVAVPVLVRLPPRRGRPRSARPLRPVAGRRPGRRRRPLLRRQRAGVARQSRAP